MFVFSVEYLFYLFLLGVLPDPVKAQDHLKRITNMLSDKKFYDLMKTCVGSGQDCAKISKAVVSCLVFTLHLLEWALSLSNSMHGRCMAKYILRMHVRIN